MRAWQKTRETQKIGGSTSVCSQCVGCVSSLCEVSYHWGFRGATVPVFDTEQSQVTLQRGCIEVLCQKVCRVVMSPDFAELHVFVSYALLHPKVVYLDVPCFAQSGPGRDAFGS